MAEPRRDPRRGGAKGASPYYRDGKWWEGDLAARRVARGGEGRISACHFRSISSWRKGERGRRRYDEAKGAGARLGAQLWMWVWMALAPENQPWNREDPSHLPRLLAPIQTFGSIIDAPARPLPNEGSSKGLCNSLHLWIQYKVRVPLYLYT